MRNELIILFKKILFNLFYFKFFIKNIIKLFF